jgi:hypothetical protein
MDGHPALSWWLRIVDVPSRMPRRRAATGVTRDSAGNDVITQSHIYYDLHALIV